MWLFGFVPFGIFRFLLLFLVENHGMLLKKLSSIPSFLAGDATLIREWLHPEKDGVHLPYSIAFAELEPGAASLPHRLRGSSEVYIVIEGAGIAHLDGQPQPLQSGELLLIPAGAEQFIENTGTGHLRFICIVAPAWRSDDEVVF